MVDPLGVVLLALGLPGAVWPRKLARFEEQLDSIGSQRSLSDVEPADWKVGLTRVVGAGVAAYGALLAVGV